jgi:peptidoglycan/xylan/chitin deacetylase (PgdA/CDA1 family)
MQHGQAILQEGRHETPGMMAALGRFISKLSLKGMPFFKL